MSTNYLATFDRVGGNHGVAPLTVAGSPDAIAEQIFNYVKPLMISRDVDVVVDVEARAGTIFAGFHLGGHITLEPTP